MRSQRISFKNRNGAELSAVLELPAGGPPIAFALFAHCFTCSKNLRAAVNVSRALSLKGIAVLRFDFTGLGESEGDFTDTNFSSNVEDLIDAAGFLRDHYDAPSILVGHSLGGAAVIQAAAQLPEILAVATVGAPAEPVHVAEHLVGQKNEIKTAGEAMVTLAGRSFRIKKQFLDDLEASSMERFIRELKRPLLIFHSPTDEIVGIENAGRIYQTAKHPKNFISLDQADHLLANEEDSRYVGSMIAAWARQIFEIAGAVTFRKQEPG